MSLHPSLKIDPSGAQQRSVLSRIERIKDLMKKGLWRQGQDITGLPKTKVIKIKAKKPAKAAATDAAGAAKPEAAAAPAASPAPTASPKAAPKAAKS